MSYRNPRRAKCHGPRVLTNYTVNGYEAVILENELLRVVVTAGRGGDIPEMLYKPADLDVMYKPFEGQRHHNSFIPSDHKVRPLFEYHPQGWFECFPSGSSPVEQRGADIGFHGEVWGLPFEINSIEEDANHCAVTMTTFTHRTPWKLVKTYVLRKNDPLLYLEETATNLGVETLSVMWGQHPFYGAPFVDGQCYVDIPAKTFFDQWEESKMVPFAWPKKPDGSDWSKVRPMEANASKMLFLTDLAEGKYRLCSPTWGVAFEMRWDKRDFPWCWYYENAGGTGSSGWGRVHGVALEPFTGLPKAIELDKGVIKIAGGQSKTVRFEAGVVKL